MVSSRARSCARSSAGVVWRRGSGGPSGGAAATGAGGFSRARAPRSAANCAPTTSWTTIPAAASSAAARRTPRTLTSVRSWRSDSVGMRERLLHRGIVLRHERPGAELAQEGREPDAAEADRGHQIEPAEREARAVEPGHEQPEEVHQPHDEDHGRDLADEPRVALHAPREEEYEGEGEVQGDEPDRHRSPGAVLAGQVPWHLLPNVCRPDQEELRERHVRPQHHEGEHQVAEVVQVGGGDQPGEGLPPAEADGGSGAEGERGEHLAHPEAGRVDGRVPVRLERHGPVDGREGYGQAVEREPRTGEQTEAPWVRIGTGVALARPLVEDVREAEPGPEIDERARVEEEHVQVGALVAEQRIVERAGPGPDDVDVAHADGERQEEERQERQRARRRLEDAPQDEAPRAAREVVEHEDHERPERDAEAVEVADQPGAEEVARVREPARGARAERDHADDQRALLEALEPEGRLGRRAHRGPSVSSACRSAGGTSASVARWLRCRARM